MSEERGFEQIRRHRPRVHWDERPVAPRRVQVNRLGNQLLARAAFALQQDGRPAGRHLRHQVENLQHRLALADDVLEVVALLQRPLELDVFFFRPMPCHRRPYIGEQLFVVPWLLDEVGGARLHGLDCILDGSVSGDHDHREPGILCVSIGQDVHAVAVG